MNFSPCWYLNVKMKTWKCSNVIFVVVEKPKGQSLVLHPKRLRLVWHFVNMYAADYQCSYGGTPIFGHLRHFSASLHLLRRLSYLLNIAWFMAHENNTSYRCQSISLSALLGAYLIWSYKHCMQAAVWLSRNTISKAFGMTQGWTYTSAHLQGWDTRQLFFYVILDLFQVTRLCCCCCYWKKNHWHWIGSSFW